MLKFDESRACDAIVRYLEAREKATRANVVLHDSHSDPEARIELTCTIGQTLYALEHTGIEPFADFMRLNNEASRLTNPIKLGLADKLPGDEIFELHYMVRVAVPDRRRLVFRPRGSLSPLHLEFDSTTLLPVTHKRLDPHPIRGRALTVRKIRTLSDLDDITVRIADVAANLAVFGYRLRDELRSSTSP
jgi:hypothetical protein